MHTFYGVPHQGGRDIARSLYYPETAKQVTLSIYVVCYCVYPMQFISLCNEPAYVLPCSSTMLFAMASLFCLR